MLVAAADSNLLVSIAAGVLTGWDIPGGKSSLVAPFSKPPVGGFGFFIRRPYTFESSFASVLKNIFVAVWIFWLLPVGEPVTQIIELGDN
jgi:hypothetical protein